MHLGAVIIPGLLAVTGNVFSTPISVPAPIISQNESSLLKLDRKIGGAPRNRLYACTGVNFEGSCEYVPVPRLGSCMPTPDGLRSSLASIRTQEGSALLYQGDNCTGTSVRVDVNGIGDIQGTVYRSWFVPP